MSFASHAVFYSVEWQVASLASNVAGTAGIEPALEVLETPVLPLYDVPVIFKCGGIVVNYCRILAISVKNRKGLRLLVII